MRRINVLDRVVDSLDIETFIVCKNEEDGKKLGYQLMKDLGFKDADVVFIEYGNGGARIRLRANIFKPGDYYKWIDFKKLY
ncbi:MAG: hypothetical protein KAW42_05080 [Candidatus Atribacteria bacterium]|jgi:hypothetical protein|nr:hypothetical protein [Candidatus Atribacteria bacterium]MCK4309325.1 hypothetical protein [Candidatus Atribacteria bacterium]